MSQDAEDESEKSFEPTQRRLEDARKRGEVPQSADLVTAAAYAGLLLSASVFGASSLLALGAGLATLLAQAPSLAEQVFVGSPQPLWADLFALTGGAIWVWFALPAGAALLCLVAQGALVVAPQKLAPQLSRVSPLAQARQKFGHHGLVEFGKGLFKIALYAAALGWTLAQATPDLVGASGQPAPQVIEVLLGLTVVLLGKVVAVALVLGAADLLWQRLAFLRRHRMSRKEMTDEMKEAEGDPHLKQERRQKGISIAMNRMLNDVPSASVVIVNPTHYAVALRWDRASGGAPVCVAKGVDEIAARIRERAMAAGVPIHRDPPTARAIHASVEVGEQVRRPEWRAVAAAIRFAEGLRDRARKGPG
ncbi:EscU/YscU/HrcU family type III secretion system export apparatus switch protein [Rubellimicrobium roseum]|uniref:Flagellar biosynthesis protein FlhB n=1 Tax=Rubellimicrobium roseum TaxID=687525 RepID=A0A5C4NDV0_9RHOB|nr:flagellar type III secretion system protein FlhB [Rubellimicrobium roseum]TNC71316.1 flagellar biosynthesis protein FlhB [Rubellimicrobium roseum]